MGGVLWAVKLTTVLHIASTQGFLGQRSGAHLPILRSTPEEVAQSRIGEIVKENKVRPTLPTSFEQALFIYLFPPKAISCRLPGMLEGSSLHEGESHVSSVWFLKYRSSNSYRLGGSSAPHTPLWLMPQPYYLLKALIPVLWGLSLRLNLRCLTSSRMSRYAKASKHFRTGRPSHRYCPIVSARKLFGTDP